MTGEALLGANTDEYNEGLDLDKELDETLEEASGAESISKFYMILSIAALVVFLVVIVVIVTFIVKTCKKSTNTDELKPIELDKENSTPIQPVLNAQTAESNQARLERIQRQKKAQMMRDRAANEAKIMERCEQIRQKNKDKEARNRQEKKKQIDLQLTKLDKRKAEEEELERQQQERESARRSQLEQKREEDERRQREQEEQERRANFVPDIIRRPVELWPRLCVVGEEQDEQILQLPPAAGGYAWFLIKDKDRFGYFADDGNPNGYIDDTNPELDYETLTPDAPGYCCYSPMQSRNLVRIVIGGKYYEEIPAKNNAAPYLEKIEGLPKLPPGRAWVTRDVSNGCGVLRCFCLLVGNVFSKEQYEDPGENYSLCYLGDAEVYANTAVEMIVDCEISEFNENQFWDLCKTLPSFSFRANTGIQGTCTNIISGKTEFLPPETENCRWLIDSSGYYVYFEISPIQNWTDDLTSAHTKYFSMSMGKTEAMDMPTNAVPLNYDNLPDKNYNQTRNLVRICDNNGGVLVEAADGSFNPAISLDELSELPDGFSWYRRKSIDFDDLMEIVPCSTLLTHLDPSFTLPDGCSIYYDISGSAYINNGNAEVVADSERSFKNVDALKACLTKMFPKMRYLTELCSEVQCEMNGTVQSLPVEAAGYAWYVTSRTVIGAGKPIACYVYCKIDINRPYTEAYNPLDDEEIRYVMYEGQSAGFIHKKDSELNYDALSYQDDGYPNQASKRSNLIRLVSPLKDHCYRVTSEGVVLEKLPESQTYSWCIKRSEIGFEYVPVVIPKDVGSWLGYSFVNSVENSNAVTYNIAWRNERVIMSDANEIVIDFDLMQRSSFIEKFNPIISQILRVDLSSNEISLNNITELKYNYAWQNWDTIPTGFDIPESHLVHACYTANNLIEPNLPIILDSGIFWQIFYVQNVGFSYKMVEAPNLTRLLEPNSALTNVPVTYTIADCNMSFSNIKLLAFAPAPETVTSNVALACCWNFMSISLPRRAYGGCGWWLNGDVLEEVALGFEIPNNVLFDTIENGVCVIWQVVIHDNYYILGKFQVAKKQKATIPQWTKDSTTYNWQYRKISPDRSVWAFTDNKNDPSTPLKNHTSNITTILQLEQNIRRTTKENGTYYIDSSFLLSVKQKKDHEKMLKILTETTPLEYVAENINGNGIYIPAIMGYGTIKEVGCETLQNLVIPPGELTDGCVYTVKYPGDTILSKVPLADINISKQSPSCFERIPAERMQAFNINNTYVCVINKTGTPQVVPDYIDPNFITDESHVLIFYENVFMNVPTCHFNAMWATFSATTATPASSLIPFSTPPDITQFDNTL